jgi:hypothetical protein
MRSTCWWRTSSPGADRRGADGLDAGTDPGAVGSLASVIPVDVPLATTARLALALLVLAALLLMHGIGFPASHLPEAAAASAPSTLETSSHDPGARRHEEPPPDDAGRSHHGTLTAGMCAAIVLATIGDAVRADRPRRLVVPRVRRPRGTVLGPEPPVPRLLLAI